MKSLKSLEESLYLIVHDFIIYITMDTFDMSIIVVCKIESYVWCS